MTITGTRVRHAETYTLTDEDRALTAEALVGFRTDFVYLERVLWAARSRLDAADDTEPAPPTPFPPPPPPPPPPEEVAERMAELEPRIAGYLDVDGACLVWTGSLTGAGQPVMRLGPEHKVLQVRRWGWEQLHGAIPGKRRALSEDACRPRCVRPDHVVVLPEGVRTRRLLKPA